MPGGRRCGGWRLPTRRARPNPAEAARIAAEIRGPSRSRYCRPTSCTNRALAACASICPARRSRAQRARCLTGFSRSGARLGEGLYRPEVRARLWRYVPAMPSQGCSVLSHSRHFEDEGDIQGGAPSGVADVSASPGSDRQPAARGRSPTAWANGPTKAPFVGAVRDCDRVAGGSWIECQAGVVGASPCCE